MTTRRLSSWAIINIHHGFVIDHKRAVKICLDMDPRMLSAANLIFDGE